jgi:FixJ family two-component response regulator
MAHGQPAIVLVEDDDGLRDALAGMLAASGFRVLRFANAEACLAGNPWDQASCLVVDVRLPGMSGLDLVREVRQRGDRMPVIVITADARPPVREAAARAGVTAFLEKPIERQTIVAAVRDAIAG